MSVSAPVVELQSPYIQVGNLPVDRKVALSETARLRNIDKAWKYYKGDFPPALPVARNTRVNDNVVMNYIRNIIDKGATFLFGKEPTFSQSEVGTQPTQAEKDLRAAWRANKKMTFLAKVAIQGGISGHVFVKVVPADPYPRLILLDTQNVTVQTDPDDIETVLSYTVEYSAPVNGRPGVHRQVISRKDALSEQWTIVDYEREVSATVWTGVGGEAWQYDFCPIVDCQNMSMPNEFYGISDIPPDILALNEAINLTASNISRILKHHANPKTWGRGFRANQVESNVDNFLIIPSDTAEVKNLEMHSDLASSLHYLEELQTELHEASRMPEIALGKVERLGAITGVALAVLHSPLIEKTEAKQNTYGDLLVEINAAMLTMMGHGDNTETVIAWAKLLPSDPLADRQAAVLDKNLGVSQETILSELGYDAVLEMDRAAKEAAVQAEQVAQTVAKSAIIQEQMRGKQQAGNNDDTSEQGGTNTPGSGITDSIKTAQYESSPVISGNGQ